MDVGKRICVGGALFSIPPSLALYVTGRHESAIEPPELAERIR
jgi:hypothetical protein